ncbi:hypothetical protein P4H65_16440, partial [Paenibacillus chitinolyticus]|uniref:hypothetical protein n=1 Tax=Paenibacillus chitinolyticus TaxID=79263 RepID=UPI002DBFAB4A
GGGARYPRRMHGRGRACPGDPAGVKRVNGPNAAQRAPGAELCSLLPGFSEMICISFNKSYFVRYINTLLFHLTE